MDYLIISFISNNPIVICMGTQVLFKKLITKAKVSISLQDIHKSKLTNIITIDVRLSKTCCWSMVFLIMADNISSTKEIKMEIEHEHEGIGIELTFKAKQSHNSTFKLITLASIKR
jgi:hypothetical protein